MNNEELTPLNVMHIPGDPCDWTRRQWCNRGIKPRPGAPLVKLQSRRVGGRIYSSKAWLTEFFAACEAARAEPASAT